MEKPTKQATIHLKLSPMVRDRLSGKLRSSGITMQGFFADICHLIVTDDDFFTMLQRKREALPPPSDSV